MNRNQLQIEFPAEWAPQSGVQLTWPHAGTDWKESLEEVTSCYVSIAKEIIKREKLLIVCRNKQEVIDALGHFESGKLILREIHSNDTWARDHGAISVNVNGNPYLYDFTFNGWGLKFAANLDNRITGELFKSKAFQPEVGYKNMMHCVLEGGSIESDGQGTLLTTSKCLLSPNRNEYKDKAEISDYLQLIFGAERILWLNHGFLSGDDTDSHIDTLARFCDAETIAYVRCEDKKELHFEELSLMEKELQRFKTTNGKSYRLIDLPMADEVLFEGERLPATYANFLIINGAVLMPTYNSPKDKIAENQLKKAFPDRELIGINCLPLIKQHGSLHCVTMQFPEGIL
ncbi:MAG: agmatine deiminase family protein [Dysgonamonadaceae bacterium]|jgi:agmatine/peptidylarginine deiminase|nr:agmatine deiminase family protein [Dysgonamonadaceae bacterium]